MKKAFKYLTISILILILLRGWIFRLTVNYILVGERDLIVLKEVTTISELQNKIGKKVLSMEEVITIARSATIEKLSFTTSSVSSDPNEVLKTGKANCVGYAAVFNAVVDFIIINQNAQEKFKSKHLIGEMNFLGINLHNLFQNPFFKDHDYNSIQNLKTKERIFIDTTISDYLGVNRISSQNIAK